jgi:hypothetical protein
MRESNDIRTRPPPDLIIGGWRVLKYKKTKRQYIHIVGTSPAAFISISSIKFEQ